MAHHVRLLTGSAFVFLVLSGCHGGGSSSSSGFVPSSDQTRTASSTTASFSVFVAAPTAGVKTPQSLVVSLLQVNGAPPSSKAAAFTMNLTLTTHACAPLVGGAVSCTATVPAPVGNDTFVLTTYSGLNGTGTQIATSQAKSMIAPTSGKTKCPPTTASTQKGPV